MFSDPVCGKDFFGRQEILGLLDKRVEDFVNGYRQNVALIGHQKLGKTSILHHFLTQCRRDVLLPIYTEVKPQALDCFVHQFARSLLFQYLSSRLPVDAMESYECLLEKARKLIPATVRAIEAVTQTLYKGDAESAYARVFELTSQLYSETGQKSVVVLDEFHRLGDFAVRNPFQNFGRRIMLQKDTLYIISSSSFTISRRILSEKLALLFGNFDRIYLEPFSFEASLRFIESKLDPIPMKHELKKYLIALTDGHPFYLHMICRQIKHHALMAPKPEIDSALVTGALKTLFFDSQGILYQYFMNLVGTWRTKLQGNHMLLLVHLANGQNKLQELATAVKRSPAETSRQLKDLMGEELIVKNGVFYHLHDKLLQFWLRFVYQPREFSLLVDTASKGSVFAQKCAEHIEAFIQVSGIPPRERIMQLFRHFRNELIEFDSRGKYLPLFHDVSPLKGEDPSSHESIIAKTRGQCWICQIQEKKSTEKQVLDFIQKSSATGSKNHKKVLIALKGMDQNAKLLAKNKKIWTLNLQKINTLLDFYGQMKIIALRDDAEAAGSSGDA